MPCSDIATRLAAVRERIAAAAQRSSRNPADVRLVAVTKGVDPARVEAAIAAGVTDVGENRVREAQQKQAAVTGAVRWHMVGRVQRNKAARVARMFDVVHSLDGARLAATLADHREPSFAPVSVLIEVDLTGIPGRAGVSEAEVDALARDVARHPRLRLSGLTTIAPPGGTTAARPVFERLRSLRDGVQAATGLQLADLSMGMSDDFEVAVEAGATLVRIGRALFAEPA